MEGNRHIWQKKIGSLIFLYLLHLVFFSPLCLSHILWLLFFYEMKITLTCQCWLSKFIWHFLSFIFIYFFFKSIFCICSDFLFIQKKKTLTHKKKPRKNYPVIHFVFITVKKKIKKKKQLLITINHLFIYFLL